MREIDITKLQRYDGGLYDGKIDWQNNIGSKLSFIYNEIQGEIEIIDYVKAIPMGTVTVKYKDNIVQMKTNQLTKCSISKLIGRNNYDYLHNIGDILTTKHNSKLVILEQIQISHNYNKYKERGYTLQCLDCNHIYDVREVMIASCPLCSDRVSYPEKFVFNVLRQLKIDFEVEKTFIWAGLKRYDIYIKELNMIIEVNGLQHYTSTKKQKNDKLKFKMASTNDIKLYIVIDAKESNVKYLKQSLLSSELTRYFDLSVIDWFQCNEYACKSLVYQTSIMWRENKTIDEISKYLNLCSSTIKNNLRLGNDFGYCVYDKHINCINGHLNSKKVKQNYKPVVCINTGEIFESQKLATRAYNLYNTGVNDCCAGRIGSAGKHPITGEPLKWKYYIKSECE